jgi:hypothetical protein
MSATSTRCDQHAVRAAELALVLHEGLHVLVFERQLLRERCIDAQAARGHEQHHGGDQREHDNDDEPVPEDQVFERGRYLRRRLVGIAVAGHANHLPA